MNPIESFRDEVAANIRGLRNDPAIRSLSADWLQASLPHRYSYNFSCLSRPIIQYPQDMVAVQELIWRCRPDLIIETGIAHGGSLVLSASMLALLDYCDAVAAGSALQPRQSQRRVIGIDIDIRAHNRAAIEAHPLAHLITLVQGSSIDPAVVDQVRQQVGPTSRVMVMLDSNHTHEHVLAELQAYAPLVTEESYCIVFDTVIEDLPADHYPDRPWSVGNSPKSAVRAFLQSDQRFEVDRDIDAKLQITVAPEGFLRRVR